MKNALYQVLSFISGYSVTHVCTMWETGRFGVYPGDSLLAQMNVYGLCLVGQVGRCNKVKWSHVNGVLVERS